MFTKLLNKSLKAPKNVTAFCSSCHICGFKSYECLHKRTSDVCCRLLLVHFPHELLCVYHEPLMMPPGYYPGVVLDDCLESEFPSLYLRQLRMACDASSHRRGGDMLDVYERSDGRFLLAQ